MATTLPAARTDDPAKTLPPDTSTRWSAAEANAYRSNLLELWNRAPGWINVLEHEADPTGVSDSAGAIQAAVDAAISAGAGVYFPPGTYLINSPIVIPHSTISGLVIRGDSKFGVTIRANASMAYMIQVAPGTSSSNISYHIHLEHLTLDGDGQAQVCFEALRTAHAYVGHVKMTKATVAAMRVSWGWCNLYEKLFITENGWSSGTADGIVFYQTDSDAASGANNACTLRDSSIIFNGGVGIRWQGGSATKILNCAIEKCLKTGIYIERTGRPINIDTCYLEFNGNYSTGTTGVEFSSPAVNIKAQIVINAGTDAAVMASDQASNNLNDNIEISNCWFLNNATYPTDYAIWLVGARSLYVHDNYHQSAGKPPLIGTDVGTYTHPWNVHLARNIGFEKDLEVRAWNRNAVSSYFSTWRSDRGLPEGGSPASFGTYGDPRAKPPVENYAPLNLNGWASVDTDGGGTWRREADYRGWPVFSLGGVTSSDVFGFTVDVTALGVASQPFYFGAWVSSTYSGADPTLWASPIDTAEVTVQPESGVSSGVWRYLELSGNLPASGNVSFGLKSVSSVGSERCWISRPVLTLVGNHADNFYREGHDETRWLGTAAPTAGTWPVNAIVWNSAPAAGGAPGWVCVTAGTPGTWKAMANLAA